MSEKRKLRIAVNMRFVIEGKLEGIGWVSWELARRLATDHPEVEFHFLFDRKPIREFIDFPNVVSHSLFPQARHPFLWYWWFEHSVPARLRKIRPDLFLTLDGYASLNTKVPQLMLVHDIAFEHFADQVDSLVLKYYRHFSPRYVEKVEALAAVSEATKNDMINTYRTPADKITVVRNGVSDRFVPLNHEEQKIMRDKFTSGRKFFSYVGSMHPRKNVIRLLDAFEIFSRENQDIDLALLGRFAWKSGEIQEKVNRINAGQNHIHLPGHLDPENLAKVLASSEALLYPSLYEGFGLPILEAYRCQVPVLTSNVSSMPEVAGDAAILVDPYSVQEISEGMKSLVTQDGLRAELVKKGLQRVEEFSWDKSAKLLWKKMDELIRGN
jgi:glycosyltransferase involved in cell wall biosynthesis